MSIDTIEDKLYEPKTLKLKQYARFICSYDLNELPIQIK
jgi:hypothetical protein